MMNDDKRRISAHCANNFTQQHVTGVLNLNFGFLFLIWKNLN